MFRIAILASGEGTNFEYIQDVSLEGVEVSAVISDNPDAPVLGKAQKFGVPFYHINFDNKAAAERALTGVLKQHQVDLIVLTGFMRILSPSFLKENVLAINIHPGLISKYPELKGKDPQKKALELGLPTTGNTIHVVTEEIDSGEILAEEEITIVNPSLSSCGTPRTLDRLCDDLKISGYSLLSDTINEIKEDKEVEKKIAELVKIFPYKIQYKSFKKLLQKLLLVHLKKNLDYSPLNIIATGEIGIQARLLDKIIRIMNLTGWEINPKVMKVLGPGESLFNFTGKKKDAQNEAAEDAYLDGMYNYIAILFRQGKWGK